MENVKSMIKEYFIVVDPTSENKTIGDFLRAPNDFIHYASILDIKEDREFTKNDKIMKIREEITITQI